MVPYTSKGEHCFFSYALWHTKFTQTDLHTVERFARYILGRKNFVAVHFCCQEFVISMEWSLSLQVFNEVIVTGEDSCYICLPETKTYQLSICLSSFISLGMEGGLFQYPVGSSLVKAYIFSTFLWSVESSARWGLPLDCHCSSQLHFGLIRSGVVSWLTEPAGDWIFSSLS